MLTKIASIAGALARGFAAALALLPGATKWTWDVLWATARMPFELMSTRPPLPAPFEPTANKSDIIDEGIEHRKRIAAVQTLDRDGLDTVMRYAKADSRNRVGMDLSAVKADVRTTLLTMDDHELRALSTAGVGAVRKFIDGKAHGIHGVPVVYPVVKAPTPVQAEPPANATRHEKMLWRIRAELDKDTKSQAFALPRP